MTDPKQFVLVAGVFLVIAVVMLSLGDIQRALPEGTPGANDRGFGPDALPFGCDFTREGAGPDDMEGRFTLRFDATRDGAFAHCATLTRGTALRPQPGGEVICLAHRSATPQDLWEDASGGVLRIFGTDGARYQRRERAPGADAFAPTIDVIYTGFCEGSN